MVRELLLLLLRVAFSTQTAAVSNRGSTTTIPASSPIDWNGHPQLLLAPPVPVQTSSFLDDDSDTGEWGNFQQDSECSALDCLDVEEEEEEECVEKARHGDCFFHAELMLKNCPRSCMVCRPPEEKNFTIGVEQTIPPEYQNDPELIQAMAETISATERYMSRTVMEDDSFQSVRTICRNYHEFCAAWTAQGYCQQDRHPPANSTDYWYMMATCAPSCHACDRIEEAFPCFPNNDFDVIREGDLDRMFRQIVGELELPNRPDYKAVIHSRPNGASHVVDGPWVVTLEGFLNDEECDRLVELGRQEVYEPSALEDEEDSVEGYRTSFNSWCSSPQCTGDPVTRSVIDRIRHTTGVPPSHFEALQMLHYSSGQSYKEHHDTSPEMFNYFSGPRILTFFLYLSNVEEGGQTRLTDLRYGFAEASNVSNKAVPLEVTPKKGMALVWPNVDDYNILRVEKGTYHEAMPIVNGTKLASNAWLRLRNSRIDCNVDFEEDQTQLGESK